MALLYTIPGVGTLSPGVPFKLETTLYRVAGEPVLNGDGSPVLDEDENPTLYAGGESYTDVVSYPANWLENTDEEWLTANGITVDEAPAPPQPPITADHVVAERSRRLSLGFDYDFGDARGVHHVGTTDADMKGWDEVAKASQAFIALGAPSTAIGLVTNTGAVEVTALEFQQILAAAAAARQPLWAASFVLQAMDPIPADYADDAYWL